MRLVAVGSSWGGLAALSTLLSGLPPDVDGAIVVAQHRSDEESPLADLLAAHSPLPVAEVEDKDDLAPGRVYLAPPGYHVLVQRGRLALSVDEPVQFARPSLDVLLESAADAYGPDCVGVVLTGANADGAAGLARIEAAGGAVIVQDPATAERAEMPSAALAATRRATVAPLTEIAGIVAGLCGTREPA